MTKKQAVKNLHWLWSYQYLWNAEDRKKAENSSLYKQWHDLCLSGDCDWIFSKWLLMQCIKTFEVK